MQTLSLFLRRIRPRPLRRLFVGSISGNWRSLTAAFVGLTLLSTFAAIPASAKKKKKRSITPYSVPVKANDLVYVGPRDLLYAATAADSTQLPNSLVVINPHNGQIETSISLDGQPFRLALSDDESVLYAALQGLKVQRINLASQQIDFEFPVVPWPVRVACPNQDQQIADIKVMPGSPGTVAVSVWCPDYDLNDGVALYDNGVQRPLVSPFNLGTNVLAFGSTGTLFAGNTLDNGFDLYELGVSDQGLTLVGDLGPLLDSFNEDIQINNGLLYTQKGRVESLSQKVMQGRFYTSETLFADDFVLDASSGQAYFEERDGYDFVLLSFDTQTYRLTGYYRVSNTSLPPQDTIAAAGRMALCRGTGLAVASIDNNDPYHAGNNSVVIFPLGLLQAPVYAKPDPQPMSPSVRVIPLPHYGLVYDPVGKVFYASTPGAAGPIGNSVVPVDPFAGTVGDPVWVGSDPQQMAVSDNGQYLYVSLFNSFAIRRLDLPGLKSDLFFNIYGSETSQPPVPTRAGQILPIPGSPQSIVVARMDGPGSDDLSAEGVAVYDNDVKRPSTSETIQSPTVRVGAMDTIQLSAPGDAVYGLDSQDTDYRFAKLGIDGSGLHFVFSKLYVNDGISGEMRCQNDQCFTNSGEIIDATNGTLAGFIQFPSTVAPVGPVEALPDLGSNRVYFLAADEVGGLYVAAFDATNRQEVALYNLHLSGLVSDFQMWNGNQLAFSNGDAIVLFPLSLLKSGSGAIVQ